MAQSTPSSSETSTPEASSAGQVGPLLKKTREEKGKDVTAVAETLRIRREHLIAIEDSNYDALPGPTYAVGFVRTYAEFLGLDGQEMVRRFKAEGQSLPGGNDLSFPTPAREGGIPSGALIVIAVLLAGLVYGGWQLSNSSAGGSVATMIEELPDRFASLIGQGDDPATDEATSSDGTAPDGQAPEAQGDEAQGDEAKAPDTQADEAQAGSAATGASADETASPLSAMPSAPAEQAEAPAEDAAETPAETPGEAQADPAPAETPAEAPQQADTPAEATADSPPDAAAQEATADASQDAAEVPAAPNLSAENSEQPEILATGPFRNPLIDGAEATDGQATPAAATEGGVTIKATGDAWIEISRDGRTVTKRMLLKGETFHLADTEGMEMKTGNAGGTQILFDGKLISSLGDSGRVTTVSLDPEQLQSRLDQ